MLNPSCESGPRILPIQQRQPFGGRNHEEKFDDIRVSTRRARRNGRARRDRIREYPARERHSGAARTEFDFRQLPPVSVGERFGFANESFGGLA